MVNGMYANASSAYNSRSASDTLQKKPRRPLDGVHPLK